MLRRSQWMMPKSQGEAFCDGVFAVAITLLFLESKVPDGRLAHELLPQRPSFTSYGVSFLFIGIIWVNHHAVSRYVLRVDRVAFLRSWSRADGE